MVPERGEGRYMCERGEPLYGSTPMTFEEDFGYCILKHCDFTTVARMKLIFKNLT